MIMEQLRNYRVIKKEHRHLEQRLRTLERRPDSEEVILQPLRECYEKQLADLVTIELTVEQAITKLTPLERHLVRLRYIEGLPWHRVAVKIQYSEVQAKRIGRRVLHKLERQ
jgi:DNA-directed RNA polymerase specialized sigma24 family protein